MLTLKNEDEAREVNSFVSENTEINLYFTWLLLWIKWFYSVALSERESPLGRTHWWNFWKDIAKRKYPVSQKLRNQRWGLCLLYKLCFVVQVVLCCTNYALLYKLFFVVQVVLCSKALVLTLKNEDEAREVNSFVSENTEINLYFTWLLLWIKWFYSVALSERESPLGRTHWWNFWKDIAKRKYPVSQKLRNQRWGLLKSEARYLRWIDKIYALCRF